MFDSGDLFLLRELLAGQIKRTEPACLSTMQGPPLNPRDRYAVGACSREKYFKSTVGTVSCGLFEALRMAHACFYANSSGQVQREAVRAHYASPSLEGAGNIDKSGM